MGLSSKKQTTRESSTSSQNATSTTVRNNPAWVNDAMQGFTGKVTGLLNQNPQDFVAGANPLQTQAGQAAAGLGGWQQGLGQAQNMVSAAGAGKVTPQSVSASSLLEGLDNYMNPYREEVVDAALADFDVDAGRTRAAQAAAGARNQAFGGSRFGVREAQTEGELSRARATTDAGLRRDMFNTAAALSGQDADRRQQAGMFSADLGYRADAGNLDRQLSAGGLLGSLSEALGSGQRADIGVQAGIGGDLRAIENAQRQAPLGLLGSIGDLLGQGQFDLFSGATTNSSGTAQSDGTSTTKSSPSLMEQIGQAIQIAATAAAMSDERTKTDVETLGYDDRGRRWVSWRYLWEAPDAPKHTGVMAQEIQDSDPGAVIPGPLGFLMVDYSKLEGSPWQAS